MGDLLNCSSCGASNQLPEGKTSMFCSFCGSAIVKVEENSNKKTGVNSVLKEKPTLTKEKYSETRYVDGFRLESKDYYYELSLINRNVESFEDVTNWFTSDNELSKIGKLNLSKNKISKITGGSLLDGLRDLNLSNNNLTSVKGLSEFSITKSLDLSNNNISVLDGFPYIWSDDYLWFNVYLNNNKNLTTFSDEVINIIAKSEAKSNRFSFFLGGCDNFEFKTFQRLIAKRRDFKITLYLSNVNSDQKNELREIGFSSDDSEIWEYSEAPATSKSGGSCFIATATMGSYDHPEVMELRHFRDNWILEKKWGQDFVKWYYHYGSIVAKSIEKSFVLKKICYLLIVKPLVYLSRIVKFK